MPLEYDLVIIGASPEGMYAAQQAIKHNKRVALVEQSLNNQTQNCTFSIFDQITTFSRHYNTLKSLGYFADALPTHLFLAKTQNLVDTISKTDFRSEQLAILAAAGVDVILGSGSFSSSPHLSFTIDNRNLRSRSYLLATGSISRISQIPGLEQAGYLTLSTFGQYQFDKLMKTWTILGASPGAIALTQYLSSLTQKVILLTKNDHILPQEDREISHLLQAQLEAMGIQVITQANIQEVKSVDLKKEIFLEKQVIESDEILLTSANSPYIENLNLNEINVKFDQTRIFTNSQLQTTNAQVYACGSLLGGHNIPEIGEYEARVILNNVFSSKKSKKIHVNYSLIPYSFSTYPTFARIGLTETQARQKSENNIQIIKTYFKSQNKTQLLDTTTGICKLIINSKQEILGVHILGNQAAELITLFTVAIQQKIKLDQLVKINSPSPLFFEILQQLI
jgi:pyruvate/2-oxoglutarate dehydrogenase complex dihydrolipoamide dehydrogenase (E3) component